MNIRAVPLAYNGTTYRSTLEADWAATFDRLGWYYEYEPWAVDLGDGVQYRADFHLPGQEVWCEVKGGHNQRMHKVHRFYRGIRDERRGGELFVVLRPAGEPARSADWHCVTGDYRNIAINLCTICDQWCFNRLRLDAWLCRHCGAPEGLDSGQQYIAAKHAKSVEQEVGSLDSFGRYGRLPFASAPRAGRRNS